jgi:acylphosphatase
MSKLVSCDFEVYGKVQKVFFRKYTQHQALALGIRGKFLFMSRNLMFFNIIEMVFSIYEKGWCKNTTRGTVKGILEGEETQVRAMMRWLQTRGSPKSVILKVVFGKLKEVQESSAANFLIKY